MSTEADIAERMTAQAADGTDFHGETMKQWDKIRGLCAKRDGSDLPRLMFEGLIESFADLLTEGAAEITKLRAERDAATAAARFVRWAMQDGPWQGGDLDGGAVQDMAESLGLIVPVPYDPEKHGSYNDYGCDAGDPWFEFSPSLPGPSALLATEEACQ